jgi:hypothetical protein
MSEPTLNSPTPLPGTVSGRKMVLIMFGFGSVATLTLWAYWQLHMMPFMPLQEALVAEFGKDSAPRVEGGQRKIHKNSTRMLRVVLKVNFNPADSDPDVKNKVETHMLTVRDTAAKHVNLDDYDTLELHLFQDVQEERYPQLTIRKNIKSWQDVNEDGTPLEGDDA